MAPIELARRFEDAGVAAIIYTDIDRDGVLQGLNLPATAELARATSIPVIASGGLAGIDDVKALLQPEYAMLEGAIAGRALYDGRLDAREALGLIARSQAMSGTGHTDGQGLFRSDPGAVRRHCRRNRRHSCGGRQAWIATIPSRYELSSGKVSRMMINL